MAVLVLPQAAFAIPPATPRNGVQLDALQQDAEAPADEAAIERTSSWSGAPWQQPAEYEAANTTPASGGQAAVSFTAANSTGDLVQAGSLPVSVGAVKAADGSVPAAPSGTWKVELASRATTEAAEIDGALITLTPPTSGATPVNVQLDYNKFEDLYGTEWASRLHLVQFPECFLTTPDVGDCSTPVELSSSNDPVDGTVQAAIDPAAAPSGAQGLSTMTAGGGSTVLGAVDSGAGAAGTYKATPLAPSGSWTAGGSGGGFSWSYPLTMPSAPNGPAPQIAFSYSSQAVDGKTSVANGQASWIGDGWDYDPGSIERRYRPCSDDLKKASGDPAPNNDNATDRKKGDLCWAGDNVVMSLGGATTELVHDKTQDAPGAATDPSKEKWVAANDDGTRIEHRTDVALGNGDDNGEYWIVTTRDGTRYYFGRHDVDGGGSHAVTNSVFTVPVFGNNAGEPCHADAFADSHCGDKQQAWRWNLDYVEDTHQNAMVITWAKEYNYYALNKTFKTKVKYVRGGYPTQIDYGLRADNLAGVPAGRVTFSVVERCVKEGSVSCSDSEFESKNFADKQPWYDTPSSLNCKVDVKSCYVASPTFWSRKRLSAVTTWAQRTAGSTDLSKVDLWRLDQSFPKQRTETYPPLWLEGITRTGYGTDRDESGNQKGTDVPPVTFMPNVEDMPNRVRTNDKDPRPGFDRLRVETIRTETGGDIHIGYSAPCPVGGSHPAPEHNTTRCYPVRWSPDAGVETAPVEWFNKYVVTQIVEKDRVAQQPDVVTSYDYDVDGEDSLWAKADDEFSTPELRTYSQWHGYPKITVRKGAVDANGQPLPVETGTRATVQSQTTTRYFRGMDGDPLPGTDNKRDERLVLTDASGVAHTVDDAPAFQGMAAETLTYTKAGGSVDSRSVSIPTLAITASRPRPDWEKLPPLEAHRTAVVQTDGIQKISGGRERATRTSTTYENTYGLPVSIQTRTLGPDTGADGKLTARDEKCVNVAYIHNTATGLIGLPNHVRATVGACAASAAATGNQIISDVRAWYDDLTAYGKTPTRGLVQQFDTLNASGSGWISASTTYDALGRPTSTTNALGQTSSTDYSPATGTAFVTTVTDPDGKTTTTTTSDPGRSNPISITDVNNHSVRSAYDNLGRVTGVWTASRSAGGQAPNVTFDYQMASNLAPAVTTHTLRDNGTYSTAVTIYDGLFRPVQTQTQALGGGRIVTDTQYNSSGLVARTNNGYLAPDDPTALLFHPESDFSIPSRTDAAYDGLSRPVQSTTSYAHNHQPVTSSTVYGGDYTDSIPPSGGTATRTFTDVLGRTSQIAYFTDPARASSIATSYEYDARGQRTKVTDQKGNVWSYTYDLRGRLSESSDPDTGTSTIGYDDLDRPTRTTDGRQNTQYTVYDTLSRKTELRKDSAAGELLAQWTYDSLSGAKGKPVASTRFQGGQAYTTEVTGYDAEYRPTGTKITIPDNATTKGLSGSYSYSATYTPTGKPLTSTLPATPGGLAAEKLITRYNDEGSAISTSGLEWYTADTIYSPFGEVLRTATGSAPTRLWTTNVIDDETGKVKNTITDREAAPAGVASPHRVTNTGYDYDNLGNITGTADARGDGTRDQQCFSYDLLGRLTEAWTTGAGACAKSSTTPGAGPATSTVSAGPDHDGYWQSYTFDEIGNRTKLVDHSTAGNAALDDEYTFTYGTAKGNGTQTPQIAQPHTLTGVQTIDRDPGKKITSASSYSYDGAGNNTTRTVGGDTQTLNWTLDNKLDSVDNKTDATTDATYLYDADGNRLIQKTASGATLYLGEAEVTVNAGGTATNAVRTYGNVIRTTGGKTTGHKLTCLISDPHGTATASVDLSGDMTITRRKFDPYGNPRGTKPASWPGSRTFLGTGIDDPTAGLTHIGAREYDPGTGRFISADPVLDIGDPMQMNGYGYANGNPVGNSDPTGLCVDCDSGSSGGSGGGVGSASPLPTPTSTGTTTTITTTTVITKKGNGGGNCNVNPMSWGHCANKAADWVVEHKVIITSVAVEVTVGATCYVGAGVAAAGTGGMGAALAVGCGALTGMAGAAVQNVMTPGADHSSAGQFKDVTTGAVQGAASTVVGGAADLLAEKLATRLASRGLPKIFGGKPSVPEEAPTAGSGSKSGSSCPTNSFVPGTLVLMADGTTKPIETVENGDIVLAGDPDSGKNAPEPVAAQIEGEGSKNLVEVTIATAAGTDQVSTATSITATDGHPFWVTELRKWIDATDLKVGQLLQTSAGTYVQVTAIRRWTEQATVHNLTVADLHTYYVLAGNTPILVHNVDLDTLNACPTTNKTHFATVTVHDSDGNILHDYSIRSGAQTPPEKAMGSRGGDALSHTENRAARMAGGVPSYGARTVYNDEFFMEKPVPLDGHVVIDGTAAPCPSCMGAMRRAANDTGATFTYIWDNAGKPAWWSVSG